MMPRVFLRNSGSALNHVFLLSLVAFLFCFGLWQLAIMAVLAPWLMGLVKEEQALKNLPVTYPTFEQQQLLAILEATDAGQFERAALLKRNFQQEW